MCGILGIIGSNLDENSLWIKKNISKLNHRGPDNQNVWVSRDKFGNLGHTRLSIIDLSEKNNQPLQDLRANVCISFNGEIYNFLELKKELIHLGYFFETNGDTEVILKSYIQWGKKCFEKFQGMFAICIFDQKKNKVFLLRDQYGEKPLYYSFDGNQLKFGSELKIFLDTKSKVNLKNLNKFFYNGFVKKESLINNIKQVQPGTFLEFEYLKKSLKSEIFWRIPEKNNNSKINHEEIIKILKNSISKQLRSDVPMGFLLSGGIDSSFIVSLASEISNNKVKTFTVSDNQNESIKEKENAKKISQLYNTEHFNLKIEDFKFENFMEILNKFDEPIIDSSIIPTYSIYKEIKKDCKVVIGGDGGDEIFGGYNHFQNFLKIKTLKKIPLVLQKKMKKFLEKKRYFYQKGNMYLDLLGSDMKIIDIPNYFNEIERKDLFKNNNLFHENNIFQKVSDDLVKDGMKNTFNNYLPEDIMFKIDRCSMLHSLEARTPFLDKNLVEYIFQNSEGSDHVSFFKKRKVQKELAKGYLPNEIINQKKRGFSFNFSKHLEDKVWKNEIYKYLTHNESIFSKEFIDKLFLLNQKKINVSEKIFGLLFFEIWRKKFNISI